MPEPNTVWSWQKLSEKHQIARLMSFWFRRWIKPVAGNGNQDDKGAGFL